MFSFECMQHKGRPIGVCIERYYVGSCCYFNSSTNEFQQHYEPLDHQSTNLASQPNTLKLRKVDKQNEKLISTRKPDEITVQKDDRKRIDLHSTAPSSIDRIQYSNESTNLTNGSTDKLNEENDAVNFINSTNLEQTKPINLIDLNATTHSADHSESINYSSAILNNSANLTNLMSEFYGVSAIISELSKYHTKQPISSISTSPVPFDDSNDKLIDKNFTFDQLTTANEFIQAKTTTTTATITATTTTEKSTTISPIEKYFRDQGLMHFQQKKNLKI